MSDKRTFRIAVRKFQPFEDALRARWGEYVRASGCDLTVETVALELHPLYESLFEHRGLASGAWDVALVVTDWLAEADKAGALLDLSGHLPTDHPEAWADSLLRAQRFGNRVLGVPYHDGPECLVYRTDLLAEAGLEVPSTWDDFHAAARALSDPSHGRWGTAFAAFPDGHNTVYDFCLQLWTRGGELFDANGRLQLDQPAAHAALRFYRAMLCDPSIVHPSSREMDSVASGFAFARGEVAMMVNWFGFAAMSQTVAESKVKGLVAIAPVPLMPGGARASLNVYWLLAIGAGSQHAEVAQGFVRYCASARSDKLLTLGGGIGCRRSTWQDAEVNAVIPFYRELETIHEHARELPRLAHWSHLAAVIDRMVTAAINSSGSITRLTARAQSEADAHAQI